MRPTLSNQLLAEWLQMLAGLNLVPMVVEQTAWGACVRYLLTVAQRARDLHGRSSRGLHR